MHRHARRAVARRCSKSRGSKTCLHTHRLRTACPRPRPPSATRPLQESELRQRVSALRSSLDALKQPDAVAALAHAGGGAASSGGGGGGGGRRGGSGVAAAQAGDALLVAAEYDDDDEAQAALAMQQARGRRHGHGCAQMRSMWDGAHWSEE